MNRDQKMAWFALIVIFLCFAAYLAMLPLVGFKQALCAFGLIGLVALSPLIFHRKRLVQGVACDERDRQIARKATAAGGMASYLFFVLALIGVWGFQEYAGKAKIYVAALPLIVCCGAVTLFLVRSVVLLVLYHRGNSYAE